MAKTEKTIRSQLVEMLKTNVKKDLDDQSEVLATNLQNILNSNRAELSKMYDTDYTAFKGFLLECVHAVSDFYTNERKNVFTVNKATRDALKTEAENTARKFYDKIVAFVIDLTQEKINAIQEGSKKKGESKEEAIRGLQTQLQEFKDELFVEQIVHTYMEHCAVDPSKFLKGSFETEYTAATLDGIVASIADDVVVKVEGKDETIKGLSSEAKAVYATLDEPKKLEIAKKVRERIAGFSSENEKNARKTPAGKAKVYTDRIATLKAEHEKLKEQETKLNEELKEIIGRVKAYVLLVAEAGGKKDEAQAQIDSIDYIKAIEIALSVATEQEQLLKLQKLKAEFEQKSFEIERISKQKEVKEEEVKVALEIAESFNKFLDYDAKEKSIAIEVEAGRTF